MPRAVRRESATEHPRSEERAARLLATAISPPIFLIILFPKIVPIPIAREKVMTMGRGFFGGIREAERARAINFCPSCAPWKKEDRAAERIIGKRREFSTFLLKTRVKIREKSIARAAAGTVERMIKSKSFMKTLPPRAAAAPAEAQISACPSLVGRPNTHAAPDHMTTVRREIDTPAISRPSGKRRAEAEFSATEGQKRQKIRQPRKEREAERKTEDFSDIAFEDTAPVTEFAQSVAPSTKSAAEKMISGMSI